MPGGAAHPSPPTTVGRMIAERYGFALYDALIWAVALEAGCGVLYSEDMQAGQSIQGGRLPRLKKRKARQRAR